MHRILSILIILSILFPLSPPVPTRAEETPPPQTVTIPGTLQSKLGCSGDWQPECAKSFLSYDAEDDVWQGIFQLPAGSYEYKAALNKSWTENYGLHAKRDGANIPLALQSEAPVKFYYDHKSHWVTDNINSLIAVVTGDFQQKLGCNNNDDPTCLRSWLQDPEGSGTYSFATSRIPEGTYHAHIAMNESPDQIYGADGVQNGQPISFTVPVRSFVYFAFDATTSSLSVSTEGAPRGNLGKAKAHWVTRDTILWGVAANEKNRYSLLYDPQGAIQLSLGRLKGGQELSLTYVQEAIPVEITTRFPQLAGMTMLRLRPEDLSKVPEILKGQIAVVAYTPEGKLLDATGVQIPGVLDDLFYYSGKLGVSYENKLPVLRVWAPTARSLNLLLYADSRPNTLPEKLPLIGDPATGVWTITGKADWTGKYYLYQVDVFVASQKGLVTSQVTDPYSISLSTNSKRSQIVDLNDPKLAPEGWNELQKPPLAAPEDIVVYELHIRDFSAYDTTLPANERGTFKAFTHLNSPGMQHLKALAEAGLSHIHLLPAFDIASVDEDKTTWKSPDPKELAKLPPDAQKQQELVGQTRGQDGYNWGYDPYHYNAPEGSYATNPDGATRILEFREMVQALNTVGLRVVMDVVYNHTNASGLNNKSVLDKIAPGYYHRLNNEGTVETSTCCQNTASEHRMMEKLMLDSLVLWSTAYKVDGFRFDLMGHHMLSNMKEARSTLNALNLEMDGVDGKSIYLYGEGWNFGEVANNARGVNATQLNIGGSGIGVFNDRLRDGARGGGPFSGLQEQGFVTGLLDSPNGIDQGSRDALRLKLFRYSDWIKIGLAGNLKDFRLIDFFGRNVAGGEIDYNGQPAGYTQDPQENILYVSAHDNETLFDAIQLKAPITTTLAERGRMQTLGLSLVLLGQGVPFIHAGDDILRSKSLDRNSYDSGDWFNRLDFTLETNTFGSGLPPTWDNNARWPLETPLLADPALKPQKADMLANLERVKELLAIRKSSPLFRLRTAEQVEQRLTFANAGSQQIPGVIVMNLSDLPDQRLDANFALITVVFNANQEMVTVQQPVLKGVQMALHPVQAQSNDPVVRQAQFDPTTGSFTVPGRTAAVFVAQSAPALVATPTSTPTTRPTFTPTLSPTAAITATPTLPLAKMSEPTALKPAASPISTNTPMVVNGIQPATIADVPLLALLGAGAGVLLLLLVLGGLFRRK